MLINGFCKILVSTTNMQKCARHGVLAQLVTKVRYTDVCNNFCNQFYICNVTFVLAYCEGSGKAVPGSGAPLQWRQTWLCALAW